MIKDLRKKTDIELGELISSLKVQLLEYRFKMANGDVEDLHKISAIRKMIATAMTVLSERNIKVSFTTHSIQLIKVEKGKQQINAIKLESLAKEVNSSKKTEKQSNKKPAPNKSSNQVISKESKNNKQSTSSNLKNSSNNRQKTVAIRRTAKG